MQFTGALNIDHEKVLRKAREWFAILKSHSELSSYLKFNFLFFIFFSVANATTNIIEFTLRNK